MFQLDLFEPDEVSLLRSEVIKVRSSNEKVRKSLLAKNGELMKMYLDLEERIKIIERNICQKKS